ncbi:synaptotagmin-7 [Rhopalosiphum maidis]|uniref:synaptotagmin-7 n=2 Tax=Rhopalosiphum TaxID=40931 RepID=UPI000F003645|nr:synaptotagmin-7 [Rhopalosiphum maidis]XP_026817098.1 synaptotagmin-7 [Rhopalosiphum maidis]XP_060843842.1 synaptotagmin-7 isoform X1 [Rhopalosiphum padi]XP_060843843.1 synaptotagmin-7 isoform X1 [Rhopalosiphum padi]
MNNKSPANSIFDGFKNNAMSKLGVTKLLSQSFSPNFGGGSSSKPGHAASADDVSASASSHYHHGGSSSAASATEHLLHKDIAAVAQGGWNVTKSLMNVKAEEDNHDRCQSLIELNKEPPAVPSEKVGQINFGLEYDYQQNTLILRIIAAKDLPAMDLSGTSDPYVRVTLLPDKKHRLDTKVKRRTLNPRWNETLYFQGFTMQKLHNRTLHLHVFDYDRFSRDDSIGETYIELNNVDFTAKPVFWKDLTAPLKDKCGHLLTSLSYNPMTNNLTLGIIEARNLKAMDINGKSDPYVKVWLHVGDKKVEKRKSMVFKCNLNPIFDEKFEYTLPVEQLREAALEVMVMDFDNIGRNELIGKITISSNKNATGQLEAQHWKDMLSKPKQSVEYWHRLKPE